MKATIKTAIKWLIGSVIAVAGKTALGRYLYNQILSDAMSRTQRVAHQGVGLVFSVPNGLNLFRVDTFSSKEPETLKWIDDIPRGSVIWDIGANVRLYSCYAAKARGCRVFAFEPSVFNLELLARNTYLNGLSELVTIIPLPLSSELGFSKLNMTTTEWGGALSTFGFSYGSDGQPMHKIFEFATIGLSITEAIDLLKIPRPDFIKIDVDGIEHLILKGGAAVLRDVQGILVEINDNFRQQAEDAVRYLTAAGLLLKEKRCWREEETASSSTTYNQIWGRNPSTLA